ncbi:MAG TPA: carboxymuconolactone decarboxylase family protein [Myxococcota bacterium]|jgi:AhpD family alkylhydroperoxidase
MRLEPIEKPRGLLLRLAYWLSRRQLGKVMSSLAVIYGRAPALAWPGAFIVRAMERGLSLDRELRLLITTQSSLINGCTFCADLHMAQAVQGRIGLAKFKALPEFATSSLFSERERSVLAYTEEVTRRRSASDAVFENLRKHVSEKEIVEITWLNAVGNFFNLMAVPLELESDDFMALALRQAERRPASLRA